MNRVIIVVPQYKLELTPMESFSLNQCENILGGGVKTSMLFPSYALNI